MLAATLSALLEDTLGAGRQPVAAVEMVSPPPCQPRGVGPYTAKLRYQLSEAASLFTSTSLCGDVFRGALILAPNRNRHIMKHYVL